MLSATLSMVAVFFGLVIGVIHFFSHHYSKDLEKHHFSLLSLSGGATLALIFLIIIPEVKNITDSPWISLIMLFGFSTFYLAEKYIYQHVRPKSKLARELKELHIFGFFIDHFLLGFILVNIIELNQIPGFLVVIPIMLHTLATSVYMAHIHGTVKMGNRIFMSGSTLLGVLVAIMVTIEANIQVYVMAWIVGVLLFVVSRDVLPQRQNGKPLMFVIGLSIVAMVWFLLTFGF